MPRVKIEVIDNSESGDEADVKDNVSSIKDERPRSTRRGRSPTKRQRRKLSKQRSAPSLVSPRGFKTAIHTKGWPSSPRKKTQKPKEPNDSISRSASPPAAHKKNRKWSPRNLASFVSFSFGGKKNKKEEVRLGETSTVPTTQWNDRDDMWIQRLESSEEEPAALMIPRRLPPMPSGVTTSSVRSKRTSCSASDASVISCLFEPLLADNVRDGRVPVANAAQFARNLTKVRRVLDISEEEARMMCIHYANTLQKYKSCIRPHALATEDQVSESGTYITSTWDTTTIASNVAFEQSSEGPSTGYKMRRRRFDPTTSDEEAVTEETVPVVRGGRRLVESRDNIVVHDASECVFHGQKLVCRDVHSSVFNGDDCSIQGNENQIFGEDCDVYGENNIFYSARFRVYGRINRLSSGEMIYGVSDGQSAKEAILNRTAEEAVTLRTQQALTCLETVVAQLDESELAQSDAIL